VGRSPHGQSLAPPNAQQFGPFMPRTASADCTDVAGRADHAGGAAVMLRTDGTSDAWHSRLQRWAVRTEERQISISDYASGNWLDFCRNTNNEPKSPKPKIKNKMMTKFIELLLIPIKSV
jgi:hypothetical protein